MTQDEKYLDSICIRAQNKEGKWGSYSLLELWSDGNPAAVYRWFMERVLGLEEGAIIGFEHVLRMAQVADMATGLVRMKTDEEKYD